MTLAILAHLIVLLMSQSATIIGRAAGSDGFSLELIHRDSPASPLYAGNLTEVERIQRMVMSSESNHLQNIRPRVFADKQMYLVKVGIGSNNPPVALHLWVSLGYALTWTQCEPCSPRFPQHGPMFNPAASATFQPIPGHHPICKPPDYHPRERGTCQFLLRNPDGTNAARGMVAHEKFTFASGHSSSHTESIEDVIFGCAHETWFPPGQYNPKIGGMFGMSPAHESFPAQLAARSRGNFAFSYCLLNALDNRNTYLRFGLDQATADYKSTQLILREGLSHYYVRLSDISVGGHRLNLPPGTFRLHENGYGGCILDIVHWVTLLIRPAYDAVRNAMVTYFSRYPSLVMTDGQDMGGLDLCYHKRMRIKIEFPLVEFHFRGATLHVFGENSFAVQGRKFCLLMQPTTAATMIGTAHQANVRVVVDVSTGQVRFREGARCTSA